MYRVCWVNPIPPMPRRFRRTVVVFRPAPSPCILRSRVHPIVSFVLLQSAFSQSPARARLRLERLPWGLVPLHDISQPSPPSAGRPASDFVPPSAFRTLSTVSSSIDLAHLFRYAAVSRVLAPGVASHDPAAVVLATRYPRAVGAAACRLPGSSERRVDLRVLLRIVVRSVRRVF
jgi:hypothetical protein